MTTPNNIPEYKETITTGSGPSFPVQADFGLLAEWVKQTARTEATAGGWSSEAIAAHEGPLPGEVYVGTTIDTHAASASSRALEALGFDAGEKYQAKHAIGPTTLGVGDSGLPELEQSRARLSQEVDDLKAKISRAEESLQGKAPWSDGATYPAPLPEQPLIAPALRRDPERAKKALDRRPEIIRRRIITQWSTVLIGAADIGVLMLILGAALDTNKTIEIAAVAVAAVLAAVALPHAIGIQLSELLHGAPATLRRWVPIVGFGAVWLLLGSTVATLRTSADRIRAIGELVTQSRDGGTPLTYAQATDQVIFDSTSQFLVWFSLVLMPGAVVLAIKWFSHNPALDQCLSLQTSLAITELELSAVTADISRSADKVETLEEISTSTAKTWELYPKVLHKMRSQLIALYRLEFINALAEPASTGYLAAIDPVAPTPPIHIVDDELEEQEA